MIKKIKQILVKIRCPLVCYIVVFTIFFFGLHVSINYITQSSNYHRIAKENTLIERIRVLVKKCEGDYSASLIYIKNDDPKRFIFREVIAYSKIAMDAVSAKELNSDYRRSYPIDDILFSIVVDTASGSITTPDMNVVKKSKTFQEIMRISNSKIEQIAILPIKYRNGNIRFAVQVSILEGAKKCTRNDVVNEMSSLILRRVYGAYY